jgi:hypothetical protein
VQILTPADLRQPSLPISLPRKKAKGDGEEEDEEGEEGEGGGVTGGEGGEATPRSAAAEGEEYELDADGNQIEEVDEEGNAILDDAGNPVMKKKPKPVDPNLLTPEEEELRAALLVESSESCEEGEAWYAHVCSRMLTYAHVCSPVRCWWSRRRAARRARPGRTTALTYADVC